jgi:L-alanine-DL-glutamate epimerase-like enolase superfamily enzyme
MQRINRRSLLAAGSATFAAGLLRNGLGFAQGAAPRISDLVIKELTTFRMPDAIYVKLTTDSGAAGWGECASDGLEIMETFVHAELAGHVVGRDPFDSQRIWNDAFFRNHDLGPGGALANAIAGIDIALWDLKGRVLGVPVHDLLGGKIRNKIRVYGSFATGRWTRLTPKEAAAKAVKLAGRGFEVVKCRMQIREDHLNPHPDRTLEYVETISKAIGSDTELFIDVNNGYTAARAIQVGRVLQDRYGMRYYEEPCSDQNHSETAAVVDALDMAVIAGEKEYTLWQLAELIRYANPDFLNPDVVKAGGITEMVKIAHFAQAYHRPLILHNTRPTYSTAASLQLIACLTNVGPFMEFFDLDDFPELLGLTREYFRFEDGYLHVPDRPGIGLEVDEEKVRARSSSVRTSSRAYSP